MVPSYHLEKIDLEKHIKTGGICTMREDTPFLVACIFKVAKQC